MQDLLDPPPSSVAKPILYGGVLGAAAMGVFAIAYMLAPNLGLAGTFGIAAGLTLLAVAGLNAVPTRASEDIAALARGEDVPPFGAEMARPAAPTPTQVLIEEREARTAALRRETDGIDRASRPGDWLAKVRDLADEMRQLALLELSTTHNKLRRNGLAHLRQAGSLYRRIVTTRGQSRTSRDWGTAQIALGECLLMLGEAEGARDEVLEAANVFTAGLGVAELSDEERDAGQNGLARAEGVMASMAETRESGSDDLF